MDEDLVQKNKFIKDINTSSTYGLEDEQRKYAFRKQIEERRNVVGLDDAEPEEMYDDDLMATNPVLFNGTNSEVDKSSYTKEKRVIYHISSDMRQVTEVVPLIYPETHTGKYVKSLGDGTYEELDFFDLNARYNALNLINGVFDPYELVGKNLTFRKFLYRKPNKYVIPLNNTYNHIKSIRLVSSEIPNTLSNINRFNNHFGMVILDEDDVNIKTTSPSFYLIKIPHGNYTIPEVLQYLQTTLNTEVENDSTGSYADLFTFTYDSTTGKVEISINQPVDITLKFHTMFENNLDVEEKYRLWHMLGFRNFQDVDSSGNTEYTSTIYNNLFHWGGDTDGINFSGEEYDGDDEEINDDIYPYKLPNMDVDRYIYLKLNNYENIIVSSLSEQQIFAKFQLNVDYNAIAYNSFVDNPYIVFNDTMQRLSKLEIEWIDQSGNLVEFNNIDHSFTLELTLYEDQLSVNNYNTMRGHIDKTSYPDGLQISYSK